MTRLLLVLALALSGCASTTVRAPNGVALLATNADAEDIHLSGAGVTFSARSLRHSPVIREQGRAIVGATTAGSAGVAAIIGARMLRP